MLGRQPPRSLRALSQTCATLRAIADNEHVWRESYVHRFVADAGPVKSVEVDMNVLLQSCLDGSQGWRREALAREAMLE